MIGKDDIIIRKAILHILDTVHGQCTLSNILMDPGPDLYEFIRNHIYKIVSCDDTKHCEFDPQLSPVYPILTSLQEDSDDSFIEVTQQLAEGLYNAMAEGLDIPAADLLCVSFQAEGEIYLALLKMNYRDSYTHQITTAELPVIDIEPEETNGEISSDLSDGMLSSSADSDTKVSAIRAGIVKTHALLPAASSRLPEAIVINLTDHYKIQLLEKKYEVNGEKIFYLSERYLLCHAQLPSKKKLNILTKVINDISNKYDGADLKVKMDTKSALQNEYINQKSFDVEEIGNRLFGKSAQKKAEFDEKMEKYDLSYDNFSVVNESTVKKLEKQVLVTDTGIEISVPMETYNKMADFEVQLDVNGKSTIIIRNIDNLVLK